MIYSSSLVPNVRWGSSAQGSEHKRIFSCTARGLLTPSDQFISTSGCGVSTTQRASKKSRELLEPACEDLLKQPGRLLQCRQEAECWHVFPVVFVSEAPGRPAGGVSVPISALVGLSRRSRLQEGIPQPASSSSQVAKRMWRRTHCCALPVSYPMRTLPKNV